MDLNFIEAVRAKGPEAIGELTTRMAELPEGFERGILRQQVWEIRRMLGGAVEFFSEAGQDEYIDETIFARMRNGVFVEVGAFDGIRGSNTLFFEKFRGWSGLLIEASPLYYSWLEQNRPECAREQVAVAAAAGEADFLEITEGMYMMSGLKIALPPDQRRAAEEGLFGRSDMIKVPTLSLADILRKHELDAVDYLSIDIEGGEFDALEAFPFEEFEIDVWSIECGSATEDRARLMSLMDRNDYRLVSHLGSDQIWIKR